jgi:hypothetical protein
MTDAENPQRRTKARKTARVAAEPTQAPTPGVPSAPDKIDADFNEAFVRALKADFIINGENAIAAMRAEKPVEYVKIVAGLSSPDAGNATDRLRAMSDVDLARHIEEVAARAGYEIRRVASPVTTSGEGQQD